VISIIYAVQQRHWSLTLEATVQLTILLTGGGSASRFSAIFDFADTRLPTGGLVIAI
jgi:hypothetical protein